MTMFRISEMLDKVKVVQDVKAPVSLNTTISDNIGKQHQSNLSCSPTIQKQPGLINLELKGIVRENFSEQ